LADSRNSIKFQDHVMRETGKKQCDGCFACKIPALVPFPSLVGCVWAVLGSSDGAQESSNVPSRMDGDAALDIPLRSLR
jgi:hypothetical protein